MIVDLDGLAQGTLLILDILMPEKDAIETLAGLKDIGSARHLRIRLMTGGDPVNATAAKYIALARAFELGDTIYKPITMVAMDASWPRRAGWRRIARCSPGAR